jgi:hypothetical protein
MPRASRAYRCDAFAKRTCRERREHIDATRLTRTGYKRAGAAHPARCSFDPSRVAAPAMTAPHMWPSTVATIPVSLVT